MCWNLEEKYKTESFLTFQSVADVCGLFIVVSEERTRSYWQGHLVVGQPLDYEDGYLTKTLQGTYEIELSAHVSVEKVYYMSRLERHMSLQFRHRHFPGLM